MLIKTFPFFNSILDFGTKKRDSFYLVLDGLDQVNFGTRDRTTCLLAVLPGTMPVANQNETNLNWAQCAAFDKDLGW